MNGFVNRLLRKKTMLRTFQMTLVERIRYVCVKKTASRSKPTLFYSIDNYHHYKRRGKIHVLKNRCLIRPYVFLLLPWCSPGGCSIVFQSSSYMQRFNALANLCEWAGQFSAWLATQNIMIKSPCNVYPLTSHPYIVKLGFTGVYIF